MHYLFLCAPLIAAYIFISRYFSKKFFVRNLHKRPVFVTGCDSGFGHYLVLKLVKNGVPTFAGCFTEEGKRALDEKCKFQAGKLCSLLLDVTNDQSTKEAAKFVQEELLKTNDKLWGIVCNAGVGSNIGPDDWLKAEDYKKVLEVNTLGVIRTCHAFKPMIKQSKGRILLMTSMAGRIAGPFLGPYCVSKFATEAYGDVLRLEAKVFGYSVHLIEPGFVQTPLVQEMKQGVNYLWSRLGEEMRKEYGSDYYQKAAASQTNAFNIVAASSVSNVVDAYFEALFSIFPKKRYVIGLDAQLIYRPLSLMPTDVQDFFLRLQTIITGHPPIPACLK